MRTHISWILFFLFVVCAVYFSWHENLFTYERPLDAGKFVIWAVFVGFTAYSVYCSYNEDLFKTIKVMSGLHWGRQIGIDLYIGVSILLFLVYLQSGSVLVLLLWLLPFLVFANLATLLFLALNYDQIVDAFFG